MYPASQDGVFFVFAICMQCHGRLSRLPAGPRHKAINRAYCNVVDDPDRYAHKAFENEIDARMFAGLAAHPVTSTGVVADLLA